MSNVVTNLTPREKEIVALIAQGFSNKHICRRLNVAEGTVKIHLHNIYTKLSISNRTVLAVMALKTATV
jgi:two-component system nitrate/nitrite response regulator NarL